MFNNYTEEQSRSKVSFFDAKNISSELLLAFHVKDSPGNTVQLVKGFSQNDSR